MDESATLAVVVARLEDLRNDMMSLRDEMRNQHKDVVARNEWLQRNSYVDSKFDAQGREISTVRQEMAARRAPWWAWASPAIAALALVGPLLWETARP